MNAVAFSLRCSKPQEEQLILAALGFLRPSTPAQKRGGMIFEEQEQQEKGTLDCTPKDLTLEENISSGRSRCQSKLQSSLHQLCRSDRHPGSAGCTLSFLGRLELRPNLHEKITRSAPPLSS
ncbi:hypothetical protein MHYP_G00211380 [Metynnis hypsauchen]